MSPLTKLLWFREEEPDVFRSGVLGGHQGVRAPPAGRGAGGRRVDRVGDGIVRTGYARLEDEALTLTGVRRDQLASLCSTTDVISRLGPAAKEWGLPSGVPVVAGASDGVLANLGVGAAMPGVVACSIGTQRGDPGCRARAAGRGAGTGVLLRAGPGPLGRRRCHQQRREHARRLLIEAAWHHRPAYRVGVELRRRLDRADPAARDRGQRANRRLHARWAAFDARLKLPVVANTAIVRELAGWCWSLAVLDD